MIKNSKGKVANSTTQASKELTSPVSINPSNGNPDRVDEILTPWDIAQEWSGRIIAVMDYEAIEGEIEDDTWRVQFQYWNEGYRYWWRLSNIRKLPTPILCRGNVGMWKLPRSLSDSIETQIPDNLQAHYERRVCK